MFNKDKKAHKGKDHESDLHVVNAEGDVTPTQTSEQMQQGNSNLDNQNNQTLDTRGLETTQMPKSPEEQRAIQQDQQNKINEQFPSATAEDMKGTITDPVSFSNPAYDASIDAAKVTMRDKDKESADIEHVFKPGHYYKKGDVVRYHGVYFEALQDGHGDVPPNMWAPSSKK